MSRTMQLKNFLEVLDRPQLFGPDTVEIESIAYDSRQIQKGDLFVAIPGYMTDGHCYIDEAIDRGARALLVEKDGRYGLPYIKVENTRKALAQISAFYYGYPGKDLLLIGVTGTNGKTTTTFLIDSLLQSQGYTTGLLGTVMEKLGTEWVKGERTTPESLDLQRFLARLKEKGGSHAVIEVSSHALALYRVWGLKFNIVVFTNISPEHGEFHDSFNHYLMTKKKLFTQHCRQGGIAVVNGDDPKYATIMEGFPHKQYVYSLQGQGDINGQVLSMEPGGMDVQVETQDTAALFQVQLTGHFNAYNCLAALGVGLALGYNLEELKPGLEQLKGVPGRFEVIHQDSGIGVVVDYAHSPHGLDNLLQNARALTQRNLIVVFGCGGDRHREKRPEMGRIAMKWADSIIVTSDNPRSEDPEAILRDIEQGMQGSYERIVDRRQAIFKAVEMADTGDLIVIAGKGHEQYQIIGTQCIDFDDGKIAGEALAQKRVRRG